MNQKEILTVGLISAFVFAQLLSLLYLLKQTIVSASVTTIPSLKIILQRYLKMLTTMLSFQVLETLALLHLTSCPPQHKAIPSRTTTSRLLHLLKRIAASRLVATSHYHSHRIPATSSPEKITQARINPNHSPHIFCKSLFKIDLISKN